MLVGQCLMDTVGDKSLSILPHGDMEKAEIKGMIMMINALMAVLPSSSSLSN